MPKSRPMPRPFIFTGSKLTIGIDERYRIREVLTEPNRSINHAADTPLRVGVFVDAALSWLDGPEWERTFSPDGQLVIKSENLNLSIEASNGIGQDDAFYRELTLVNGLDSPRSVTVFWYHRLEINESDIGITAMYRPDLDATIHYKGGMVFCFSARSGSGGLNHWTCGLAGFGGLEGTWRDAEDGLLHGNPIAQGSADSTIGVDVVLAPNGCETVSHRIAVIEFPHDEACPVQHLALSKTGHDTDLSFLLSHCLPNGAVIASFDSEILETNRATYKYCWFRDGALVSRALARQGNVEVGERFLEFAGRQRVPYLQKFTAKGDVGASWHPWIRNGRFETPIQPDETALVLVAAEETHRGGGDVGEFLRTSGVEIVTYLQSSIQSNGLPTPGYDLWEERYGTHTYSAAMVAAGLAAGARLGLCGPEPADRVREAIASYLIRNEFVRGLDAAGNVDDTVDASVLLLPIIDPFWISVPEMNATLNRVQEILWVQSEVGGLARYEGDYYFRQSERFPGNPWIICTMWLAQASLLLHRDVRRPLELLKWAERWAMPTGALPEQLHPETGQPLSVCPLAWSHAEVLETKRLLMEAGQEL